MATAPTNERRLVDAITRSVLELWPAAWVLKTHGNPYQTAGLPDLLVCITGRLVGLEVKFVHPNETERHARGRATPLQNAMIAKLIRAGATAGVVTSVREAIDLIERSGVPSYR